MYNHAPEDYSCPFCEMAADTRPPREASAIVCRYDEVFVAVNRKWWPANRGGLLVIPYAHFENVYDLPVRLGTPLQQAIRDAAFALKQYFGCAGVSTRQHNEPAGNQDVWHYHVHVFPRHENDNLYGQRGGRASDADVAAVARALRDVWSQVE